VYCHQVKNQLQLINISSNNCSQKNLQNDHISATFILLKLSNPTGHMMHHQFNIQQLYVLPTLYLCVLHLCEKATCATYSIN